MDNQVCNYGRSVWTGCHDKFQVSHADLQNFVNETSVKTCPYPLLNYSHELSYHQHPPYSCNHQSQSTPREQWQFPEWQATKTKPYSVLPISKQFPSTFSKAKISANPSDGIGSSADQLSVQNLASDFFQTSDPFLHHFGRGNKEPPHQHDPCTTNSHDNICRDSSVVNGSKPKQTRGENPALKRRKKSEGRNSRKEKKKRRPRDEESWARNRRKSARAKGESYISVVGKTMPARSIRSVDCSKCKFHCTSNFSDEDRQKLFKMYWGLENFKEKVDFICNTVQEFVPLRPVSRRRAYSRRYKLILNGKEERVCKEFFTSTFDISESSIQTFLNKKRKNPETIQDLRGRRPPPNKTPDRVLRSVREHILSQIGLHGSLDRPLLTEEVKSTKRLYEHYRAECIQDKVKAVSLFIYRKIFADLHTGAKNEKPVALPPSDVPDQQEVVKISKQTDANCHSSSSSSTPPQQQPPLSSLSPSVHCELSSESDSEVRFDSSHPINIPPHITSMTTAVHSCKFNDKSHADTASSGNNGPTRKRIARAEIDFRQQIYRHYFCNDEQTRSQCDNYIPQPSLPLHMERLNALNSNLPHQQPFQISPISSDPTTDICRQGTDNNPSVTANNFLYPDFVTNTGIATASGSYSSCLQGLSLNSHSSSKSSTSTSAGKSISLLSVPPCLNMNVPNILLQHSSRSEMNTERSVPQSSTSTGNTLDTQSNQQKGKSFHDDDERLVEGDVPPIENNDNNVNAEKSKPRRASAKKRRVRNEESWTRNVRKRLRFKGEEYTSVRGKTVKAKKVKPVDCSKCKFKCPSKITEKQREELNVFYWSLDSYEKKTAFLAKHVQIYKPKRKMTGRREFSRTYIFEIDETEMRVCKNFFSATLHISESTIATALQKSREGSAEAIVDRRGMHTPVNKTSAETVRNICDLVIYVTGRRPHRNPEDHGVVPKIKQMYQVYKYDSETKGHKVASLGVFRSVLFSEFGIGGNSKSKSENNNDERGVHPEQTS